MEPKIKKPRISISPPQYLCPAQQKTLEKHFSEKKVISERYIDYEWYPEYPIAQCFAGKNMIKSLLHIRGSAPISPVLLFYSQIHNLSEKDHSFDVYIEGKMHKITPQVIASVLGFDRPLEPVSFPPANEDDLVVSKDEFRRAVYLPEHVNTNGRHARTEIKIVHLKPIIAVLVRICQSNILPAFSHQYITNLKSVYLSFLLLNGYQVDISYVIWHTMAHLDRVKTKSVPYGILVGQLLSYLGHPFPDDTPCASVPGNFDVKFLCRNQVLHDLCDIPFSELHSQDISPPPPPPSMNADDASEPIQSLKDTVEVVLPHIVTRQDSFEQQEMIDRNDCPDDPLEQQREEFMRQEKTIEHVAHQKHHLQQQHQEMSNCITSQQDCLELQRNLIDHLVTKPDCCEPQNQEMIGSIAREHDYSARCQDQHHALSMQQLHHAHPDQVISHEARIELLVFPSSCGTTFCLLRLDKNIYSFCVLDG
ncbi:hypothetical protein MKW94_018204 [Papaver nudicaule]|uniref:Putative plant transposon protein domain-containing protein n=1 Tax=Papaver nudicaule TaxID=74823 RepID=A0AA41RQE2_PAPNU|nr:hypothetical protein [Papaver nudicaule]